MEEKEIAQHVEQILSNIRPAIAADGGDIQFVSYKEGVVYVKLSGACVGCPASFYTLKLGVERAIQAELSFVQAVEAIEELE